MNNQSTDASAQMNDTATISDQVWFYRNASLIIWSGLFVVGVVGNILTIRVLTSPRLTQSSTTLYLTVLAVVDLLYLLSSLNANILFLLLFFPSGDLRSLHPLLCKAIPFLSYTLSSISVWQLVAVTVDRMIWVLFPFNAKAICTIRNSFIVSAVIVTLFVAVHFQLIITNTLEWEVTQPPMHNSSANATAAFTSPIVQQWVNISGSSSRPSGMHDERSVYLCKMSNFTKDVLPKLEMVVLLIVPFIIMIIANGLIIYRLQQIRKTRIKNFSKKPDPREQQRNSSLTMMLLFTNILFMVFMSPLLIYNIVFFHVDMSKKFQEDTTLGDLIFGVERVFYSLWYTKFSIHFFLYCLSGPRFRQEAINILCVNRFVRFCWRDDPLASGSTNNRKASHSTLLANNCTTTAIHPSRKEQTDETTWQMRPKIVIDRNDFELHPARGLLMETNIDSVDNVD